ncbi:Por secretion system C-terminal sorting domain-containing protein [Flavobacterium gillisiae]|uniref:Por secretion system C-terminal sorting domain-containing protein n=1 Tax=Flavobacterium gillisiae TaxID=150146 RepID=A0A1H3Z244_9FLAO|nr:M4 family metallopeptidase [Flavobacterium gillisiae]SEA17511.1 Por secretion system C-terminal sorting domain-containing protein [Flavobacterium gillisiae]
MKTTLLGKIALFASVSLLTLQTNAQDASKNVKQKFIDQRGKPSLIIFNEKSSYKESDSQKAFKEQLDLKDNSNYTKTKSEKDKLGFLHEKFQLFHQGVKVEFSTYTLHSKSGKLESMSGEFYQLENVNINATLSKEQAFNSALKEIGATKYLWDSQADAKLIDYKKPEGELVLLPITDEDVTGKKKEQLRLAYKYDIYATNPVSRGDIYIDAVTGKSLFYNATIKHLGEYSHGSKNIGNTENVNAATAFVAANAATRYSGNQTIQTASSGGSYILSDATRGNGVMTYNMNKGTNYSSAVNFTDADNNWTAAEYNNANKDNGALDAHWGAEKTYDYWTSVHGRNSFDGAGAAIKSYVHYSSNYDNAYWNGSVMTYGDGSGTYFDILTSIDVAAHEIGHAVCSNTANLAYQLESGAMNEAFSDIWGACIEYYAAPNKSTWLIGEDIERRAGHLALRSMSNPKSEGQPDTYGGTNWVDQSRCRPSNRNDYCGVHTNSGVLNHWFYILTQGKNGTNDIGSSYSVTGIGIDKAAKISYRLESVYLSANSTYAEARTYGIQASTDLYGATSAETIATTNAFYAVGVGAAYIGSTDTVAPTAPTSLAASGTTTTSTNLSWTASTDNVGVTGYNVYNGTTLVTTVTGLTYTVTGLSASTAYTFAVKAKDAAGNVSDSSNTVSVTTLTPTPDTTAPTAPTSLTAASTTATSTNLTWTTSTDNVAVTGYDVYQGSTLKATVTSTSYAVTGLTANTAYSFSVKAKDAAGNISASSNVISVTTTAPVVSNYCASQGNSTASENIASVVFNTINNTTSSGSGYVDYTSISTNVSKGSTYTITITPFWANRKFKEGYSVWIDFNADGDFNDAGEQVMTIGATPSSSVSGTISIPTLATTGTTRMRVSMKNGGVPSACETFSDGQVEDYTVIIDGAAFNGINSSTANENSGFDVTLYPNPTTEFINISVNEHKEGSYKIYNSLGFEIQNGKTSGDAINVSSLTKGIYFFEFNNGEKTVVKPFAKK